MRSTSRSRTVRAVVLVLVGVLVSVGVLGGLAVAVLWAFNPLGDEWVCSQGEVPADEAPVRPGEALAGCYTPDTVPAGYEADPLGNRPMSYNCDKTGWRLIEKTTGRGAGQVTECLADDLAVPTGWRVTEDG